MKSTLSSAVLGGLFAALVVNAAPAGEKRDVDTRYPYNGPAIPVADWVSDARVSW